MISFLSIVVFNVKRVLIIFFIIVLFALLIIDVCAQTPRALILGKLLLSNIYTGTSRTFHKYVTPVGSTIQYSYAHRRSVK